MDPQTLSEVIDLLDLEEIEKNHYRATSPSEGWQRVYGGQVLGQALVAASRTVEEDRPAHSLHGYFLRAGDTKTPILYKVDRIRDGKSFTTRNVVAIQHGRAIFSMSISFQVSEEGFSHQAEMPDVPRPEDLRDERELREEQAEQLPEEFRESFLRDRPIDFRPMLLKTCCTPSSAPLCSTADEVCQCAPGQSAPAPVRAGLPFRLVAAGYRHVPHGLSFMDDNLQVASLDHAMWFHRPFRADEWLLYAQDSPSASGARGFNRGMIFNQAGELVASAAQEGLMRLHQ